MALEDLVSDLSNFKTKGETAYDKLDPQINNGVDYFSNDDASGFTPKTNLESLYKKANSAVTKDADRPFIPASDGQFSQRWDSNFPTQFKNGFFPIANAVSNYNPPKDTLTHFIEPNISSGPEKTIFEPMLNTTKKLAIAHGSNFLGNLSHFYNDKIEGLSTETFNIAPTLSTGPTQPLWIPGLNDTPQIPYAHGSDFMTTPIANFVSTYKGSSVGAGSQTIRVERVNHSAYNPSATQNADYNSVKNEGPFTFTKGGVDIITLKKEYNNNDKIKDLFEFKKDGRDTFKNVPAGINENGKFGTTDFRTIANKGPFDGNSTHPIILRKPGSNWDNVLTENTIATEGGLIEGALGVVGLLTRTSVGLADKARIFRFMISNKGISFVAKQFAFQALNPTIESKIYNPLSTLGIAGASDLLGGDLSGLLRAAGSFLFPTHIDRHLGGLKYHGLETSALQLAGTNTAGEPNGRLQYFAQAFAPETDAPEVDTGFSLFDNYANSQIDGAQGGLFFTRANPNKYAFPISTAPKKVVDGRPHFIAGSLEAKTDFEAIEDKIGGTFNDKSANTDFGNGGAVTHATLYYSQLKKDFSYTENELLTPNDINSNDAFRFKDMNERSEARKINRDIGNQASRAVKMITDKNIDNKKRLGLIKTGVAPSDKLLSPAVDKVNIHPYGSKDLGEYEFNEGTKDFIKFRFYDVVNGKYIIFRAILEGITDSVTPEYSEEKYIGRPDTLYTYQGVQRQVSFTFSIYPKTKQELPVLMEKLNYLVGMCYPSYTADERMITPFMELTMGDMFLDTPGILSGLTMTVEEQSTWELDDGLQFPHFIKAACEFKHIGNYVPASKGKHYDLPWIPDGVSGKSLRNSGRQLGYNNFPYRNNNKKDYRPIFEQLGQVEKPDKVKDLG